MDESIKKFYRELIFFDANKNIFAANEIIDKPGPSLYSTKVFAAI